MDGEQRVQRQYESLAQALNDKQPFENHDFITRFTTAVGIEAFYETTGYIKAVRRDGGEPLRIYYGSTNGFASEAEIVAALGDVDRGPSQDRPGLWRVAHPLDAPGHAESFGRRVPQHDYGTCMDCFTQIRPNGTCSCDGVVHTVS